MKKPAGKPEPEATQKRLILGPWLDALQSGGMPEVLLYAEHVGIDLKAVEAGVVNLHDAVLAHYKIGRRRYDIDRAAADLLRWPPVAAHIAELTAQRSVAK